MFSRIDGAWVILRKGGIYKIAEVYGRGGELYAKYSGGFIALVGTRSTSVLNVTYEDLDMPAAVDVKFTTVGRVKYKETVL